jgi:dihydrofolate synthase/folylpolyglutamate synthase
VLALTDRRRDPIDLSFFEVATLAALGAFARADVELAVLEVGLGGRLDATSIVPPRVSVITSIGLDHTEILGSTVAAIAREKAAIARPGVPLCVGALPAEALVEVERAAAAVGAPLIAHGRQFDDDPELRPPWPGRHQHRNAALALAAFTELGRSDPRLTRAGFVDALPSARWPGRYELLPTTPRVLLDGAHNLEAAQALGDALAERGDAPTVLLFGALAGKPAPAMLELLAPLVEDVVLAPPPLPRALDHAPLADRFGAHLAADAAAGLARARELALDRAGPGGTVLVTGSLFLVAAVRRILLDEPADPPVGL